MASGLGFDGIPECANMGVSASMYFLYFSFGSFIIFDLFVLIYPTVFYYYS